MMQPSVRPKRITPAKTPVRSVIYTAAQHGGEARAGRLAGAIYCVVPPRLSMASGPVFTHGGHSYVKSPGSTEISLDEQACWPAVSTLRDGEWAPGMAPGVRCAAAIVFCKRYCFPLWFRAHPIWLAVYSALHWSCGLAVLHVAVLFSDAFSLSHLFLRLVFFLSLSYLLSLAISVLSWTTSTWREAHDTLHEPRGEAKAQVDAVRTTTTRRYVQTFVSSLARTF